MECRFACLPPMPPAPGRFQPFSVSFRRSDGNETALAGGFGMDISDVNEVAQIYA